MADQGSLLGVNMTNFFRRELKLYALGDIKFAKPISLRRAVYIVIFALMWTLPLFLLIGFSFTFYYMLFVVAPPFILSYYATKPVFGGKNLLEFLRTMFFYLREPHGWTDLRNNNGMGREQFTMQREVWISRRRELRKLYALKYGEEAAQEVRIP